jgi:hypothetical protein
MRDLSTTADRELRQQLEASRKESASALAEASTAKPEATVARNDATAARTDATTFREQLEAANKKIAELMPRSLPPEKARQITTTLAAVPAAQRRFILLIATTMDAEQRQFMQALDDAIIGAGWQTNPTQSPMDSGMPPGIYIGFAVGDKASPAGKALIESLGNLLDEVAESPNVPKGTVRLFVGVKK